MSAKGFSSRITRRLREGTPPWAIPIALYLATFCSTTFVGYALYTAGSFVRALSFSVPLMTILSAHELGHYLQLRRRRIPTTFPLFLPVPLPPFGTFGAVMKIRGRIPNRRVLFDMAASGPVAGLVASLLFLILGLSLSRLSSTPPTGVMSSVTFGAPAIMSWLTRLLLGDGSRFVLLHPCAVAAWVGLFLTSLNLAPIGQLDGGHVLYAVLRGRSRIVSLAATALICVLAFVYRFWGWLVLLGLVAILGRKRGPTVDDAAPLGLWRSLCAWLALGYLLIGFIPRPIDVAAPSSSPVATVADSRSQERGAFVFHVDRGD